MQVTKDIYHIGVNDHEIDLFEGQYPVPLGMAYNSYLIVDEKICLMDTVEAGFTEDWLKQMKEILDGRPVDYVVVHHAEPDHSSSLEALLKEYPNITLVLTQQAANLIGQFYPALASSTKQIVKDQETLNLGEHELQFFTAAMVHWPEVMMSYDKKDNVLFSADAFGKFGANDVEDPEGWTCEARRYYFGIVGKHSMQAQTALKKFADLEIDYICSLHGPVLHEEVKDCMALYQTWSSYEPEEEGIFVAYASVYGHTKVAAEKLVSLLNEQGYTNVKIADLCREDIYECVENAFRYSKLVLAAVTYDVGIFPVMREFIEHLTHRNYQKRTIGFIENGSWGPLAAKTMKGLLESCKDMQYLEPVVTIKTSLTEANEESLNRLVEALIK